MNKIIGNAFILNQSSGFSVVSNEFSEDGKTVFWKVIDPDNGLSGTDDVNIVQINDEIYHVSWTEIERNRVVSKVFDFSKNTSHAYGSRLRDNIWIVESIRSTFTIVNS